MVFLLIPWFRPGDQEGGGPGDIEINVRTCHALPLPTDTITDISHTSLGRQRDPRGVLVELIVVDHILAWSGAVRLPLISSLVTVS